MLGSLHLGVYLLQKQRSVPGFTPHPTPHTLIWGVGQQAVNVLARLQKEHVLYLCIQTKIAERLHPTPVTLHPNFVTPYTQPSTP